MKKYVDLHSHSLYSDGKHSVFELIKIAKDNNVGFFSVTDHDNIDSTIDIKKYKNDPSIIVVNGVELSTIYNYNGRDVYMHLLGYNYDPNNQALIDEISRYKKCLYENNMCFVKEMLANIGGIPDCIIESFNMYDYRLPYQQIHDILLLNGYDNNYITKFIKVIKKYTPKYEEYELDIGKAIGLIDLSGGVSVLAHPNQIEVDNTEIEELIGRLVNYGLGGIETFHSYFKPQDTIFYKKIANKNNLLESVGSDYHFDLGKEAIVIGHGINNNACQCDCSLKRYLLEKGIR